MGGFTLWIDTGAKNFYNGTTKNEKEVYPMKKILALLLALTLLFSFCACGKEDT
jgi:hypothetical protein